MLTELSNAVAVAKTIIQDKGQFKLPSDSQRTSNKRQFKQSSGKSTARPVAIAKGIGQRITMTRHFKFNLKERKTMWKI